MANDIAEEEIFYVTNDYEMVIWREPLFDIAKWN